MQTTELRDKVEQSLQCGLNKLSDAADQVSESLRSNAYWVQQKAGENFRIGRRRAKETEEIVSKHVRDHQILYVVAVAGLFGVIAAKVLLSRRSGR